MAMAGWNWSRKSITCVFMAVLKPYSWKSSFFILFSKTETITVDLINIESSVGDFFLLQKLKRYSVLLIFYIVKWSWQWPPSCLIESWMKFWMHCHTAIINWWVSWPSWAGPPVSACYDAGQPLARECGFFSKFCFFVALQVKIPVFLVPLLYCF